MPLDPTALDRLNQRVEPQPGQPQPGQVVPAPPSLDGAIQLLDQRLQQQQDGLRLLDQEIPPEPWKPQVPVYTPDNNVAPTPAQPPAEPGIFGKAWQRLLGTDVQDKLPLTRAGTTIAGGVAGGMAGLSAPGGPVIKGIAGAAGSIGGTMAGAIAPEATLYALEQAGLVEPGTRDRLGLNQEQLMRVMEGEALLDIFTAGGVSLARAGVRGGVNLFSGATRGSKALAEQATREGIAMLPVQMGEGKTYARAFVSVMGRFPWVSGPLRGRAEKSLDQIKNAFEGIPERLGPIASIDEAAGQVLRESQATTNAIAKTYDARMADIAARADAAGIAVQPSMTGNRVTEVLQQIRNATPQGTGRAAGVPTESAKEMQSFLNKQFSPIMDRASGTLTPQSLARMDTIAQNIDREVARLAGKGDTQGIQRLEGIRNALAFDMMEHVVSRGGQAVDPTTARGIAEEFRAANLEMTDAVNALIGTKSGKAMGFVGQAGGRGMRLNATSTEPLARLIERSGDPKVIDELSRLVRPETMRLIGGSYMRGVIDSSMEVVGEGTTRRFNADAFAAKLGLDNPRSPQYARTAKLLEQTGGMSMEQLQNLTEIARRAGQTEIPDVSSFIARRATLAGTAALGGILGYVIGAGDPRVGLLGSMIAIGGSRFLANAISHPDSARALSMVLDKEVSKTVRRTAYIKATYETVKNMTTLGELTTDQGWSMMHAFRDLNKGVEREDKANGP